MCVHIKNTNKMQTGRNFSKKKLSQVEKFVGINFPNAEKVSNLQMQQEQSRHCISRHTTRNFSGQGRFLGIGTV